METGAGTGDRRPIGARNLRIMHSWARRLARAGVSPNAISVAGMVCGLGAGAALWATSREPDLRRILWLSAAALAQIRLLANLLDGMVAIEGGRATKAGALYNEVPDRVSDSATLVGLGYAAGGDAALGWAAALLAMFTAYVRTAGRAAGTPMDFCGPMAKQQRMFVVTMACLWEAAAPRAWWPATWNWRLPALTLPVISAGCLITAGRRLVRAARALEAG